MDQENQKDYNNEPSVEQREDTYPDTLKTEEPSWNAQNVAPQQVRASQSTMALASLVMGILSLVTCCCIYGGFIFASLGILFALLSRTEDKMEGYAKAGLITSIISFVLMFLLLMVYLVLMAGGDIDRGGVF